jgi:MFS family permease
MNHPNSPSFFHYWSPAGTAFLLNATSLGLFSIYGLFVKPISVELETSAASLGIGMALIALVIGLTGPIIGPMLDRFSIKRMLYAGIVVMGLSLAALTQAQSLLVMAGLLICFGAGISLYGQMPTNVLIINAYTKHRARSLALAAAGISCGSIVLPPLTAALISNIGWRQGLGILTMGIVIVAALAVTVGLSRYKKNQTPEATTEPSIELEIEIEKNTEIFDINLFKSKAFWYIALGFGASFSVGSIYSFSIASHMLSIGITLEQAAWMFTIGGSCGLTGKFIFAAVADRLRNHIAAVANGLLILQIIVWLIVIYSESLNVLYIAAAGIGISAGVFTPLYPYFNSVYFDKRIMGKVNGAQSPIFIPFTLLAAPLAGFTFDSTGSYLPAFWAIIIMSVISLFLFSTLGKPPAGLPQSN